MCAKNEKHISGPQDDFHFERGVPGAPMPVQDGIFVSPAWQQRSVISKLHNMYCIYFLVNLVF